ncbi:MAG: PilZ domain-containing protein [Myxococcaceae bacterium]
MPERRTPKDRRGDEKVGEPLERTSADRRNEDRRDSPRVPMKFLVRDVRDDSGWHEREGDLSIGGLYWKGKYPAMGSDVEVRFRLPGVPREIRAYGEIIRVVQKSGSIDFHVRFTELDIPSELAIAKFLDSVQKGA